MFHTLPMTDRPRLPVRLFYRLSYHVTDSRIYKKMWKYWYPVVTRGLSADDVVFINWAYEEDPPMAIPLTASDEPNRGHIQLYHRTATQADLGGKRVLEISCGHGGGASYLTRTLHPASYTGLDLNPEGIAFCQKRHDVPGLDFVQGDAENLPFDDQSFDVVLNVEASHCYPHFGRFLAEVARVLRPGGHLLYCDLRAGIKIAGWESDLANAPMRQLSQRDINAEVLRGMENRSERTSDLVNRHLPSFMRSLGREFAGSPDSWLHGAMIRGEVSYRMYSFSKD
jgi:ubiquinone/menaquinone biosynthesis C-methylase UbiE